MTQKLSAYPESLYGFPSPINQQIPPPVIAKRDPTTSDTGYALGQQWVNETTATFFALGANAGGIATWQILGSVSSTFNSLTVNPGNLEVTDGNITIDQGYLDVTNGNITVDNGDVHITGGSLTAGWNITASGSIEAAVDLGSQTGNINCNQGNIVALTGNVEMEGVGGGLKIAEGANGTMGTSALMAGTKSISIASVDANTRVFLTRTNPNSAPCGFLVADTSVPGTLTVYSVDATGAALATDVSSFNYLCIEAM